MSAPTRRPSARRGHDRPAPWALVPAAAAPVAMIGGWTLGAALQPSFDPVRETISALAATTATAPGVMTAGLAATGLAHLGTALALRPLPARARVLHAVGGVASALVAALPVDAAPRPHGVAAGVAFGALALWPALAVRRGGRGVTSARVGAGASLVLVGLLGWFVVELQALAPGTGDLVGLSERAVAGAQALWPLVVVLVLRGAARRQHDDEAAVA